MCVRLRRRGRGLAMEPGRSGAGGLIVCRATWSVGRRDVWLPGAAPCPANVPVWLCVRCLLPRRLRPWVSIYLVFVVCSWGKDGSGFGDDPSVVMRGAVPVDVELEDVALARVQVVEGARDLTRAAGA